MERDDVLNAVWIRFEFFGLSFHSVTQFSEAWAKMTHRMSDFRIEIWMTTKMCTINWNYGILVGSFEGVHNQWVAACCSISNHFDIAKFSAENSLLQTEMFRICSFNDPIYCSLTER